MAPYELVICGYGVSGRAVAQRARALGLERVLVVEHRHGKPSMEPDLPNIEFGTTAVGVLAGDGKAHVVVLQSAAGTRQVHAKRVVVATGAHERPREGFEVAGSRPAGVMTSRLALDLLGRGLLPGREAVIYGRGLRVARLRAALLQAGVKLVAVVDPLRERLVRVDGFPRLAAVTIASVDGARRLACDTLVVAAALDPAVHLLKGSGVHMDPTTRGPEIDQGGRTNIPGIYTVGTAAAPALDHEFSLALAASLDLADGCGQEEPKAAARVLPGNGCRWVVPQRVMPGHPAELYVAASGFIPSAARVNGVPVRVSHPLPENVGEYVRVSVPEVNGNLRVDLEG